MQVQDIERLDARNEGSLGGNLGTRNSARGFCVRVKTQVCEKRSWRSWKIGSRRTKTALQLASKGASVDRGASDAHRPTKLDPRQGKPQWKFPPQESLLAGWPMACRGPHGRALLETRAADRCLCQPWQVQGLALSSSRIAQLRAVPRCVTQRTQ
jgi:hypothetical protein